MRDELLLKVLFGTCASPGDLSQNLRTSIATHEMRLLAYRQNALILPPRGAFQQYNKRPNPYAVEDEEDPYFRLVVRFAIEFEKTMALNDSQIHLRGTIHCAIQVLAL